MRRRTLVVLALCVVLVAGGVAAFLLVHRLHQIADVRGSSTVDFRTAQGPAPLQPLDVQWPMYGFQAARTRAVGYSVDPPFRTLWQFHAGSLVEFPPSIGYGRLYLATNSGKVLAVNETTGKRAWKYVSGRCVAASPAVGPHGQVYAVFLNKGPPCNRAVGSPGLDGEVIMFGAGFGNIRWRRTIGPSETSPVQIGKLVVVGDWNGDVWAFQRGTGQLTWRFHTGGSVKGGIAYRDKRFYVGSYDGRVYCLSLDGKLIWSSAGQGSLLGGGRFYSTPAVRYGRVYIGSTDGKVYSFGAATGKLRWSRSTGGYVYASPAVAGGLVFIGSYSHRFYALDAATGVPRWTFTANGPISGSPTVVGRIVYFATLTGRTYGLDTRTGKQVWTFPDGEYSPVVAVPGRFFLVGQGTIYGMVRR